MNDYSVWFINTKECIFISTNDDYIEAMLEVDKLAKNENYKCILNGE